MQCSSSGRRVQSSRKRQGNDDIIYDGTGCHTEEVCGEGSNGPSFADDEL